MNKGMQVKEASHPAARTGASVPTGSFIHSFTIIGVSNKRGFEPMNGERRRQTSLAKIGEAS